ncbi:MAG: hypothetical protein Q9157_002301 [Trypethelium eluteriae]
MSAPYIISKSLDPLFAIGIGLAAAGVRIRREEREKGHNWDETIALGKRRVNTLFVTEPESTKSSGHKS